MNGRLAIAVCAAILASGSASLAAGTSAIAPGVPATIGTATLTGTIAVRLSEPGAPMTCEGAVVEIADIQRHAVATSEPATAACRYSVTFPLPRAGQSYSAIVGVMYGFSCGGGYRRSLTVAPALPVSGAAAAGAAVAPAARANPAAAPGAVAAASPTPTPGCKPLQGFNATGEPQALPAISAGSTATLDLTITRHPL